MASTPQHDAVGDLERLAHGLLLCAPAHCPRVYAMTRLHRIRYRAKAMASYAATQVGPERALARATASGSVTGSGSGFRCGDVIVGWDQARF